MPHPDPRHRRPRPGVTKDGEVLALDSSDTFKDSLLADFDIDSAVPKENHRKFLREVIEFAKASGHGPITVSLDGFASHTGEAKHNLLLSEDRERAVEDFLRANTSLFDAGNPNKVDRTFHGFADSPRGEKAKYRSVRVAVHRPDRPPPPIRIPISDDDESTLFQIRQLKIEEAGPFLVEDTLNVEIVKVVDRDHKQHAIFLYTGTGVSADIGQILGALTDLPFPSFSFSSKGRFIDFHTSGPVAELDDFVGDAALGKSVAAKNIFLTIDSATLTSKAIFIRERPLQIPSAFFSTSLFANSDGKLKRISKVEHFSP